MIAPWLRASEFEHPVVLVDRIGQLVVLLLGEQAVVDDLAIGAVLLELVGAFAQVRPIARRRCARARPSLMIFCCSNSLTKKMYQEPTDMMTRMPKVTWAIEAALLKRGHEAIGIFAAAAVLLVLPL